MWQRNRYKNLPKYLSYKNNLLYYEGINLHELMTKYGSPLEVAYTDMINQRVSSLKDIFNSAIKKEKYQGNYFFAYATKANYYSEVVSTSLNNVDYLETSSGNDLDIIDKLFIDQLIPSGFTVICNGFKKGTYFEKIISLRKKGLNIIPVVENVEEVEMFLSQDISFNIGMRINIDEQKAKTSFEGHRSGSAVDTRFGLYFEDMVACAKRMNESQNLKFKLFHFHIGGTIYDIKKYTKLVGYLFENNYCVLKQFCPDLEFFDIGGGFPTQYNLNFNFDYKKLVTAIVKTVKQIADKHKILHPNIIGEHGRYTVADHGFFLYDISIVKKSNQNSYWYLINSSLMNYLPDSWALGQDFVVLPLNLLKNKLVKVKLGGLTCDPDDTYYKQETKNFLYLPEIKEGEKLSIGVFGVGAYQEMIAGVGGVHHCMIPEGNELIIRKRGDKLEFNNINNAQTPKELLELLDYKNTQNLIQYIDKYNIHLKEFKGLLKNYYDQLKNDFPQSQIFPYKNMENAYGKGVLKIIELYNDRSPIGYAFITLLEKSKIAILNYLVISKENRNKGFGHIFVNQLKSHFAQFSGILVEVEKPDSEDVITDKHKRIDFYTDLDFSIQNFNYEILATGTDKYFPMIILVCNLKNNSNYEYKQREMIEILNEYFTVFFDKDYQAQYRFN